MLEKWRDRSVSTSRLAAPLSTAAGGKMFRRKGEFRHPVGAKCFRGRWPEPRSA